MSSKYMDLDNLLLYQPRKKASIPNRFSDYVLSSRIHLAPNKINNSNEHEHSLIKNKTKLVKSTKKRTSTTKTTKRVNILKKNGPSNTINKIKNSKRSRSEALENKKNHFRSIKNKDNLMLNFSKKVECFKICIVSPSTVSVQTTTIENLQHKVHFNDCKPILESFQNYQNIICLAANTTNKLNKNNEINFFKFQPLVLIPKLENVLLINKTKLKLDSKIIEAQELITDVTLSYSDNMPAALENIKEEITCKDQTSGFEFVYVPEVTQGSSLKSKTFYSQSPYFSGTSSNASYHKPNTQDDPLYLSNEIVNIWMSSPPPESDYHNPQLSLELYLDSSVSSEDEPVAEEEFQIDIEEDKSWLHDFCNLDVEKEE